MLFNGPCAGWMLICLCLPAAPIVSTPVVADGMLVRMDVMRAGYCNCGVSVATELAGANMNSSIIILLSTGYIPIVSSFRLLRICCSLLSSTSNGGVCGVVSFMASRSRQELLLSGAVLL